MCKWLKTVLRLSVFSIDAAKHLRVNYVMINPTQYLTRLKVIL